MIDHFATLGLSREATDAEIKEAYRRLAKQHHPDTGGDNAAMMRRLNDAKQILFDPVKREEHRRRLLFNERMRAALASRASNPRMVSEIARSLNATPRPTPWTKTQVKRFYAVSAILLLIPVLGFILYPFFSPPVKKLAPLQQIIERHSDTASLNDRTDTLPISEDSLPILQRRADSLFARADFWAAGKYFDKALSIDTTNEQNVRKLSLTYFKRGKYAEAIRTLENQMHADSNLVRAYYDLGELFIHEEKPFDAENAFQEVVVIADRMKRAGRSTPYAVKAREKLDELE